ncbi:MAG: molybdopterin-containing oxidoreductase membrane anchor subunit [Chloroflexi bacterium]|nr:MAG: molybdopterin-containing oxidoreductase membrane anchor subunit [Chloroflexota bacterium]
MEFAELPLVLFTILTQMAIGLVLVSAVQQWAVDGGPNISKMRTEWIVVLVLLTLGVITSFFHLGHPLGAVRMLANLGTAWLSREILMVAVFGVLVVVTLYGLTKNSVNKWLVLGTAVIGILALIANAFTYAPPSMPAIDNLLPLVFFGLTMMILGTAVSSYFVPADKQQWLTILLAISLSVALVVYLVVPSIWLSGGEVMAMTAEGHLASPLHWIHVVVGLLLPLGVLAWLKRIPAWLPVLLIIGELAGRIIFFTLVVSSAANLGGIY